ncbi:MAG: mechanosensitive ion channel family protein [Candidatus Spechtbacterales bacterium]|nr:mechanosensitive ion channel family protein [Candidatus Spechtbacterales bacterium]
MLELLQNLLTPEVKNSILRVAFVVIGIYAVHKFVIDRIVERLIRKLIPAEKFKLAEEEKQREDTIIGVTLTTLHILLWIVGGMIILSELGVDIGPLIAAAGIGGLAIGFGGQYLIRDVINGLFVLLENQYNKGDVVCFGDTCGVVEEVNLRRTVLRDLDGTVHTIPNGEISIASNLSDEYARVNLDMGVGYNTELEHVMRVINRVGNELAQDPEWKDKIKEAPQFLRVQEFGDSAIVIKILGETKPMQQWAVTGELRKRLKVAFDREGIEIPFPQRVIHKPSE